MLRLNYTFFVQFIQFFKNYRLIICRPKYHYTLQVDYYTSLMSNYIRLFIAFVSPHEYIRFIIFFAGFHSDVMYVRSTITTQL